VTFTMTREIVDSTQMVLHRGWSKNSLIQLVLKNSHGLLFKCNYCSTISLRLISVEVHRSTPWVKKGVASIL